MATYTVQAPDGKTVTLQGPDGAAHADVVAQAQKLYTPGSAAPATPSQPSGLARFAQSWWDNSALKHPIDSAVGLVKSLVTFPDYHLLSDTEKDTVDQQLEKAIGNFASNVRNPTPEYAGMVASKATNAAIMTGATAGLAKGLGAAVDIAPAAAEGLKVGAQAAAPDVARGALKAGAGAAAAEILPGGPLRYVAGAAPVYSGARQIVRGLSKGYDAGGVAYNAARAPQAVPIPAPARSPVWAALPEPQPVAPPPPVQPTTGPFPSGRVPGGIQNQAASAPVDPAPTALSTAKVLPNQSLLEDLSRSLAGKSYDKLSPSAKAMIDSIAVKGTTSPPAGVVAPQSAAVTPPAVASQAVSRVASPPATVVPPPSAPLLNGRPSVVDLHRALADEMLKNGTATPEMMGDPTATVPRPGALQVAMRDLPPGAPRAIANANYAADQEPTQAAAVYDAAGRAAKAQNLSQMLYDEGLTARKVSKWGADAWAAAAKDRGMPQFSTESQGEVIDALKKLEKKVK